MRKNQLINFPGQLLLDYYKQWELAKIKFISLAEKIYTS